MSQCFCLWVMQMNGVLQKYFECNTNTKEKDCQKKRKNQPG